MHRHGREAGAGSGRCGRAPGARRAWLRLALDRRAVEQDLTARRLEVPATRLNSVVLPAPFGPISPAMPPRSTRATPRPRPSCRRSVGRRNALLARSAVREIRGRVRDRRRSDSSGTVTCGRCWILMTIGLARAPCKSGLAPRPRKQRPMTDAAGRQFRALRSAGSRSSRRRARKSGAARSPAIISSCAGKCCICRRGRGSRSIRSPPCCRCFRPSSAPSDPNDWMSSDDEVACPDPNCRCRLRIMQDRQAVVSGTPRPPPCRSPESRDRERRAFQPSPRLRNLAGDPRRLAAGRRARAGGSRQRRRRSHRLLRGRHRHLRLRRHLHRRRGDHGRLSHRICAPPRHCGAGGAQGPHQVRARSRPARDGRPRPMCVRSSTGR